MRLSENVLSDCAHYVANRESLPEPLRADPQGPHGQELEALPQGERLLGPEGRGGQLPVLGLPAADLRAARRVLALRRGIPPQPQHDLDCQAGLALAGQGHIPVAQDPAAQEDLGAQRPPQLVVAGPEPRQQGELRCLQVRGYALADWRQEVRLALVCARHLVQAAQDMGLRQRVWTLLQRAVLLRYC